MTRCDALVAPGREGRTFASVRTSARPYRLAAIAAAFSLSCSDSPNEVTTVGAVEVFPTSLAMLVDDERTLTAVVKSTTGEVLQRDVTWTSHNTGVVTVDISGRVRAAAGGEAVVRASSEGQSATSQVTVSNRSPTLSGLVPSTAVAGDGAFALTVNGSGFIDGSQVRWNGEPRPTTFVSAARLTAQIGAGDIAAAGLAQVTVFTGPPGGGTSGQRTFTITPFRITSLEPSGAMAGQSAFTLKVNGANFTSGLQVQWNGEARPTTFFSPSQLTAQIGAMEIAAAGTKQVTVLGGAGEGTSGPLSFIISASGNTFRAIYALTADQAANPTAAAAIAHEIQVVNAWFGTQTGGGIEPHWVGGTPPTITVVTLPKTLAQYEAAGSNLYWTLAADINSVAPPDPGQKTFVWIDARRPGACGESGGSLAVIYEAECNIYPSATSMWPFGATYLLAHELAHLFGAVRACAPHYDGSGHVFDSPRDLLYQGPEQRDWFNLVLDLNRDDYYGTVGSCLGIEAAPFWTQPAGAASLIASALTSPVFARTSNVVSPGLDYSPVDRNRVIIETLESRPRRHVLRDH